jgi:uncharacterized membrane protein YhiD involved in acid resistance
VAVLGIVIGQGHYGLALTGTLVILTVLVGFDSIFGWVKPIVYRRMILRGEGGNLEGLVGAARELLRAHGISVQDFSGKLTAGPEPFELELHIRCRNHLQAPQVLEKVCAIEGVKSAEWCQLSH